MNEIFLFISYISDVIKHNELEVGKRHVTGFRLFLYFNYYTSILELKHDTSVYIFLVVLKIYVTSITYLLQVSSLNIYIYNI